MTLLDRAALIVVLLGITAGVAARLAGEPEAAQLFWAATTGVALLSLAYSVVRDLIKRRIGVDVIALLAMTGALLLGEFLAGAVIALMLSGGRTLESYAAHRARRDLSLLLERAPSVAHRYEDGHLISRDPQNIRPGDQLLVKSGEIVPVDGIVRDFALVDESTLTGEARPIERFGGDSVRSGTVNVGGPFDMVATVLARQSAYAGIVRLVAQAQASRGPFVRVADRFAAIFLPITLFIAGAAWAVSGEPVRALAVLVVATPCPLILAAPVAIISGISRAARRGVIVKGGGALEALARAEIVLMDKTGTLTVGQPAVSAIESTDSLSQAELLRLAASLDQVSRHPFATAITRSARERGLELSFPSNVEEEPGVGIEGLVDAQKVRVGKGDWVFPEEMPFQLREVRRRSSYEGRANVFVSVEGRGGGALVLDDPLRADAPRTLRALRRAGVRTIVLVTGDRPDIAETIGTGVGVDRILAERSPAEKVEAVLAERANGTAVMVGDGLNDAPALAAADVGVALGARGAAAHSEAADVVMTVDRIDRLAEALIIAKRSRRIAVQSVVVGMGLSAAAMLLAAAGRLAPVAGAFLQEAIDVAVILNALRALGGGQKRARKAAGPEIGERFRLQHQRLLPQVDDLRRLADELETLEPNIARERLEAVGRFISSDLLPHESEDEEVLYPAVAEVIGGDDPTGTMAQAHREIRHLGRLYLKWLQDLGPDGAIHRDLADLRRVLYGLHAILRLHFAQEDESYLALEEFSSAE